MNLKEMLALDVTAWKPEPGDQLIGEVVEVSEAESEYGSYPLLVVVDDGGHGRAFHAFRSVARSEVAKARPKVGDKIGVVYQGRIDGKTYDGYKVLVERAEPETAPEPNWAGHAQRAEEDLGWERRLADAPHDDAPPPDYDDDDEF